MADKKKGDKPKYEVPRNEIPTTIRRSHFSADEITTTTLHGVTNPPRQDKKKD
ncbi:hypothetical protein [Pseudarthrobacter scleromae]|uniref:hypothetical protein n=1 Tax=Pseudarthrobacter scleromae TaxID=158897 RepID=UPI003CFF5843